MLNFGDVFFLRLTLENFRSVRKRQFSKRLIPFVEHREQKKNSPSYYRISFPRIPGSNSRKIQRTQKEQKNTSHPLISTKCHESRKYRNHWFFFLLPQKKQQKISHATFKLPKVHWLHHPPQIPPTGYPPPNRVNLPDPAKLGGAGCSVLPQKSPVTVGPGTPKTNSKPKRIFHLPTLHFQGRKC